MEFKKKGSLAIAPKPKNLRRIRSDRESEEEFENREEEENYQEKLEKVPVSPNTELVAHSQEDNSIAINSSTIPEIDFGMAFNQAAKLLREQSLVDSKPVTLDSLEVTQAKTNSFLDSLGNVVTVSHLREVILGDGAKFKRVDELRALNSLLDSFGIAAEAGKSQMEYLAKKMVRVMAKIETRAMKLGRELNEDEMAAVGYVQAEFIHAVEMLQKVTGGLKNVIQLERASGARPWGNEKASLGISRVGKSRMGLDDDSWGEGGGSGDGGGAPRKLSVQEIMLMTDKRKRREISDE